MSLDLDALDDLILSAQKPSRYSGGEVNAIQKSLRDAAVTWALCFPDTYEVGMSNVGFRVLYHVLNQRPDVACERTFMPWEDMEALMRARRVPLWTLESRAPVREFDVLGFTLQTELCYTTLLAVMDLAGIPVWQRDRGDRDPLVIAGGPCAYAPEPVAPFIDAFVVGEGEEVVHEISDVVIDWKAGKGSRRELLWRLAEIPGVYVPSFFDLRYGADHTIAAIVPLKPGYEKVTRRVIPDLNQVPQPERPILPTMQTVHDRLPLEIQRGCTRSCRFCQVGMLTRPTRQRDPHEVRRLAEVGLANTGYEQVGFLSLSAGDYQALNPMLEDFFERFEADKIAVSLPSLRTETMNDRLAAQIRRVRKTGFTMAPEAASERMRRVINKGNHEADLLRAAESVFRNGWSLLKLYFMIGLPTERDEDVEAIAQLAKKVLKVGRGATRGSVAINLGVSTFVPKPFTPFQWEPMLSLAETRRKHDILRRELGRGGAISFKHHDAQNSNVEGALTRGDRRTATAIYAAWKSGQALDGWTERFNYDRWVEAFAQGEAEHGVGLSFFGERERGDGEVLPWDHIDCEVNKSFLLKDRHAARREAEIIDCALDPCTACGACDYDVVTTRVYREADYQKAPPPPPRPAAPAGRAHVRVQFSKSGRAVALSHLETMTALLRALRRARVPTAFSEGFHPKPRVSFGPACPVGIESRAEFFDVEVMGAGDPEALRGALAPEMPPGFEILSVREVSPKAPSLNEAIEALHFRARFPRGPAAGELEDRVKRFHDTADVTVTREMPGSDRGRDKPRQKTVDLKQVVTCLAVEPPDACLRPETAELRFSVRTGREGSARPGEVLAALFGVDGKVPEGVKLLKEGVTFTPEARV